MSALNLSLHSYFMQVHVSVAEIVEQQLFEIISAKFEIRFFYRCHVKENRKFCVMW